MPVDVIVGTQWGDEGKGKIVDIMSETYDVIVRYQGGNNAESGHDHRNDDIETDVKPRFGQCHRTVPTFLIEINWVCSLSGLANLRTRPLDTSITPPLYCTIPIKSHMGKKIARAKNPTTAASPTVSSGPMASASFLVAYSTSMS